MARPDGVSALPAVLRRNVFVQTLLETLTQEALDVSRDAPSVDWQRTALGEYQVILDDCHTARIFSNASLGITSIVVEDNAELRVRATCPDLDTGRRHAECAHWLMHRIAEKRALTLSTAPADVLESVTCDLAHLTYWLEQADPETRTFPHP